MGVQGLTTFIANRSQMYFERYELCNTYVVIDGNSIGSQLYIWHSKCNDCFGGDYDKIAYTVYEFFNDLTKCNITPVVIVDGGYERKKLNTVYKRMKNRIEIAKNLDPVRQGGSGSLFPLCLRQLFEDIAMDLNVRIVRCDFEGDQEVARIARMLNCPVLSYDSDYFIFDCLYIPFNKIDIHPRRRYNKQTKEFEFYLDCDIYRVEKFLDSFKGLSKLNLPLLAVLLGNDYIRKRDFSAFYRQLKRIKMCNPLSEQQRTIKTVLTWLQSETFESAIRKILARFKLRRRKLLYEKILKAIDGYTIAESQYFKYLNITTSTVKAGNNLKNEIGEIDIESIEETTGSDDELSSSENLESEDNNELEPKIEEKSNEIPDYFLNNYRKCNYPACFMDILTLNCYYFTAQVENTSTNSHDISLNILSAIHKILRSNCQQHNVQLNYYNKNHNGHLKKFILHLYEGELVKLDELETLNKTVCKDIFLKILNINNSFVTDCLDYFPESWHLMLISLYYWVKNSNNKIDFMNYISSMVLCGLVLSYVDLKIGGFFRATNSFYKKFDRHLHDLETLNRSEYSKESILNCVNNIDFDNSVICLKQLISYFQMDVKMRSNSKLFDRDIVHNYAEFQSCVLHIKYLNCLLKFPFKHVIVSQFFDGTFLYNMTVNLKKRSSPESYFESFLKDCPAVLNTFELMTLNIKENFNIDPEQVSSKRRRKRRRRSNKESTEEEPEANEQHSNDDSILIDPNNKYSTLSTVMQ